jgi:MYXO-CTERM domain-containing protein
MGDYYSRAWMRVTNSNNLGNPFLMTLCQYGFELDGPTQAVWINAPGYTFPTPATFPFGGWHLVELGMLGGGAPDGGFRLWLDGAAAFALDNQDFTLSCNGGPAFGEPAADSNMFTGTIDLDDARAGALPPASTLSVTWDGGAAPAGGCASAVIGLLTSEQKAAVAPYDVVVSMSAQPEALFFSDPRCTQVAATVTIPVGQHTTRVYLTAATEGLTTVTASQGDFFSGSVGISFIDAGISIGGGLDGGPLGVGALSASLGCSCQATSSSAALGVVLLLALALLAPTRRKRN